jgi:hypothetical protein
MTKHTVQIYVVLLEEGTDTIRPAQAIVVGEGLYKLLPTQKYDPEDEIWEFPPGSIVKAEVKRTDEGEDILIATEKVEG